MVVVMCLKDWLIMILEILKMKFDLNLKDWFGLLIVYYCIEVLKDDFIVCVFLFIILESRLSIFLIFKINRKDIVLNLVLKIKCYSCILCILKLF